MITSAIFERWPPTNPQHIQLYSMATPNGLKIPIALHEMQLNYDAHIINIMENVQHSEEYKLINPNSKIPAIIDPDGPSGEAHAIMESGAILLYLAEKSGKLMPTQPALHNECIQWLFFQVGHIGPMFGQFGHFYKFAAEKCKDPYPVNRYRDETIRLLGVLENRLTNRTFIMGDEFSISDIAIFPWVECLIGFYQAGEYLNFSRFENVERWLNLCVQRESFTKAKSALAL